MDAMNRYDARRDPPPPGQGGQPPRGAGYPSRAQTVPLLAPCAGDAP